MRFLHKSKPSLAVVCLTSLAFAASAAAPEPETDPFELDLESNISLPAVPSKRQGAVKESIDRVKQQLEKAGFKCHRRRQGEVLQFTLPLEKLFRANETQLSRQGVNQLAKLKFPAEMSGKYKLLIAVHADDTGEQTYADALTAARANAIDDFISHQLQGVEIIVVPYGIGRDEPLVTNDSVLNRAKNRRADFYIVPTSALFAK